MLASLVAEGLLRFLQLMANLKRRFCPVQPFLGTYAICSVYQQFFIDTYPLLLVVPTVNYAAWTPHARRFSTTITEK
jgi:hypothetical protein